jgi:hypothetical protein
MIGEVHEFRGYLVERIYRKPLVHCVLQHVSATPASFLTFLFPIYLSPRIVADRYGDMLRVPISSISIGSK